MEATPAGASAFARHYLLLLNDAFARSDAVGVRANSESSCRSCSAFIASIEIGPGDEEITGGDYVPESVVTPEVSGGKADVLVTYGLTEVKVLDASGAEIRSRPARDGLSAQLSLVMRGGGWSVAAFRNV